MLRLEDLVKHYGGLAATDHLCLEIAAGELHAIIGPNGAGKSTLIGQLSGEIRPDQGRIVFDGRDITREPVHRRALAGLGRSYQISSVFTEFSALENVILAVQARSGHSFRFWRRANTETQLVQPAQAALAAVGLSDLAQRSVASLAHGERRQLEIAMTLASKPKLLLLDEPMAGMSQAESAELTQRLATLKGSLTIVLVEHDMDTVFALADRVTVLVAGRTIATGTGAEIRADPGVRQAYLGEQEESW